MNHVARVLECDPKTVRKKGFIYLHQLLHQLLQQLLQQCRGTWRNVGRQGNYRTMAKCYTWVYGGTAGDFYGLQGVVGSNQITQTINLGTK